MASSLKPITGFMVGLYVQTGPDPSVDADYTRVLCANSISLNVKTESVVTDCQTEGDDDEEVGNFAQSEPGQISWDASTEMTAREARGDAAAANVTAENMLDYQLAGRKFQLRYQLGKAVGSAIYKGQVYITSNGFSGANKDNVKASVSMTGTGPLTKMLKAA